MNNYRKNGFKLAGTTWALSSASLLSCLLVTGCGSQDTPQPPAPPAVTVAKPELREVSVYKNYPATLQAVSEIDIRARVSGYLQQTNFNEGTLVKKGDLLFTIEQAPYQLAVESAQADLERAEAGRELAQTRKRRLEQALQSHSVSEVEVDIAAAELAQAIASVSQAQANLKNAQLDLSYTTVHAPINGRISLAEVSDKNLVGYSDPTVITTIVDDSVIEAYFEVPEREVIKFLRHRSEKKEGESFRELEIKLKLADRSLYPLTGNIDFIDNNVDAMTRTIRVRAVFDNSKFALASGMYASVQVPVAPDQNNPTETRAILVPAAVIMRDIGGSYVWVVDEANIVHRRSVNVGETIVKPAEGGQHAVRQTIILDGLKVEDTIIISGLQRARDGAPVTPKTK
ncbi:MAG: efflux RND transporter periplasmic adaptor subunit [Opitutae bacterium]|jgi:RND family efflux transporter MFP subunit|nr:efflux RND transporter periplasmic adaptor subunit [Opitutae bacterium]